MDVLDKMAAIEKRHAAALHKRRAAEEAAEIRRIAVAKKFARSFPGFAEEVAVTLKKLEDQRLQQVPEQDWHTRRLVQIATERALVDTMLDGKQRLAAARGGEGNRHERRAAAKKGC